MNLTLSETLKTGFPALCPIWRLCTFFWHVSKPLFALATEPVKTLSTIGLDSEKRKTRFEL